MFKLEIMGMKQLSRALHNYNRRLGDVYEEAVLEAAWEFLDDNDGLVPMDTGALRASRGAHQTGKGWQTVTYVGYGYEINEIYLDVHKRIRVPRLYAVWQHEVPMLHKHGIDEYLETGIEIYKYSIRDYIRSRLAGVRP